MGRWAQRRIRGGGPATSAALIHITSATLQDTFELTIAYNDNINAALFDADDFFCTPSNTRSNGVSQLGPSTLDVTFESDVDADTTVHYDGTAPGILTPDSKVI